ncbi:MAG: hypothetical protein ACRD0C_15120 [Acidimicrobiia bacterium]
MSDHFQEHEHEALDHTHRHYHVTHNMSAGGFEHLSSEHEHEHDHAPLRHAHHPHEDFDREHHGEAHVHDHVQPVRPGTAKKATGTRKAAAAPAKDGEGKADTRRPARRTATRATAGR